MASPETHIRTCPFCEATCGLEIEMDGREVVSVRGDDQDVFSAGFICPKATGIKSLYEDPDRLHAPLIRRDGELVEAGWDEAFAVIDERITPILAESGRDAVAAYVGNPNAHNLAGLVYLPAVLKALGSKNISSASTVDQRPKEVASARMFGGGLTVAVPDLDRTDHLLMLGANPLVSNGSLMTAPNARGRIRGIRERGGKVVVIDPRRSRTAENADEHHFIRPGTDALLLFALVHVIFQEGLETPVDNVNGVEEVREASAGFAPEDVAGACGIDAGEIRRMARELAGATSAAVYGRIGTTTQEFGTAASWLVDVLNAITGNLDRPGGAMFTRAAAGQRQGGKAPVLGRWASRVRGLQENFGELPVSTLAEEIDTPGEGRVRALLTVAGNPVLSTPNSDRLERAIESLDFYVAVDIYVNETTRHADVILPAPGPLERGHYDLALYQLGVRNVANYSPPVLEPDMPEEWRTLLRLAGVFAGQGPDADTDGWDDLVAATIAQRSGIDASEANGHKGPERVLDLLLRSGPYELTLDDLLENPHGIDLGALEPRMPDVLRTDSGKAELAPEEMLADVPRLKEAMGGRRNGGLTLIGRRQLRSNNSWMHNLPALVKGANRCTLHVHPDDAERLGLVDGGTACVTSRVNAVEVPVEVTDSIMAGVVSIPHGWGH
ncbi:MAG: molybdopterin-dependent oxidoreductase, partial [Thermoleophilaceae bacterium]|nr:molybdopterin-dependent oxidoreductase [Thermoleophilaceae bacterium]